MDRLRITIEFNKNKKEELELYCILQNYSNPASYIKDVLRGLLPIPSNIKILTPEDNSKYIEEIDDEDLMDI